MADRTGSAAAGELFRQHGAMVYRRAFRILGRREDAEEAMHEVFIRVLRGGQFDGRCEITTWLYQITTNYCLNVLRNRNRRRELFEANAAPPRDEAASADPDDLILLRRLLTEADEQQARAVVYVFLDGLSQQEAAEVLGVSQRTVSNLVDRFMRFAQVRAGELRAPEEGNARAAKGKRS